MAIAFARAEPIKRSEGSNACLKSSYNSRERIAFEGHQHSKSETFNFRWKEKPLHHEVMLPKGADSKYKNIEYLWNEVEKVENRKNSQLGVEFVFALPDDKEISKEHKIELIRSFTNDHFISKGLIAQVDVHQPEKKEIVDPKTGQKVSVDHNNHAHVLVTLRRLNERGDGFHSHKVRDLLPSVVKGGIFFSKQEGKEWGQLWREHQNEFFIKNGYNIRVDFNGVVAQEHMGPVRMRARAFELFENHQTRVDLNTSGLKNPNKVLSHLTNLQSSFTTKDVRDLLSKHLDKSDIVEVEDKLWKLGQVTPLLSNDNHQKTGRYTTQSVLGEEKQIRRVAGKLHSSSHHSFSPKDKSLSSLTDEQKKAFQEIIGGRQISFLDGHAGTGKSYLLNSIRESYEEKGYVVRGFGPDNSTADVLKEKGFKTTENVYSFLFSNFYGHRNINKSNEVWVIDESSKLSNRPMLEILKQAYRHDVKLIFSGCCSQFSSVNRGGMFKELSSSLGMSSLNQVQRQNDSIGREVSQNLALGKFEKAVDLLSSQEKIHWSKDKEQSMLDLVDKWAADSRAEGNTPYSKMVLAFENREVKALNELIRSARMSKGEIDKEEYKVRNKEGEFFVSKGDIIEFRSQDKKLGVQNGSKGELVDINEGIASVLIPEKGNKSRLASFSLTDAPSFQLGYASTKFRSQGHTVDKAYVLSSKYMSRESTYVALTRHKNDVHLFVSQGDFKSEKDLSRLQTSDKESLANYTTQEDLEKESYDESKKARIDSMLQSTSLFTRAGGHLYKAYDTVVNKVKEIREDIDDKKADASFYHYERKETTPISIEKSEEVFDVKHYQTSLWGEKQLGNITLAKEDSAKTIVVVKGQEHAQSFNSRYAGEKYVAVSWDKESAGFEGYNWLDLAGRNVIVWPEHTKEGHQEAIAIGDNLKKLGCASLKVVNLERGAKKLDEGWSLSDNVPEGFKQNFVLAKCQLAENIALDPSRATAHIRIAGIDVSENNPDDIAKVQSIVAIAEEKVRESSTLEQLDNKSLTNRKILTESTEILKAYERVEAGNNPESLADRQVSLLESLRLGEVDPSEKERIKDFVDSIRNEYGASEPGLEGALIKAIASGVHNDPSQTSRFDDLLKETQSVLSEICESQKSNEASKSKDGLEI